MEKLCVEFENCFGIKKLYKDFDFSNGNAYARNGLMKTSFSKTF